MSLSDEILKKLNKIWGKYQRDIGIVVWGSTVKKEQGDYRVVRVNDEGELACELG